MNFGLRDKVAVVLAASRGMGFASAKALAREGCRLAICARTRKDLENAAGEIEKQTEASVFRLPIDITKRAHMQKFMGAVKRKFGAIHILVVNCGGPPPGYPLDLTDKDYDDAVRSTLMVAIDWMRAAAPVMVRQEWGRIIAIESTSIKQPIDGLALSNTMRAGVAGFAKSLSRQVAASGVTVNTLCPGMIMTDRLKSLAEIRAKKAGVTVEEQFKRMTSEVPAGRIGTPEEFANVVAFLASEQARYVTGTVIQVDGGAYRGLY
jgi:3-oxoacyl-[acyl-carrier protein] reductase